MKIKTGQNAYGKNAVNLSKIIRHEGHHEFRQISVNISLEGDFETAHTIGDNSKILPTDTMKNTVYVLAKDYFTDSIEEFGLHLARHFKSNNPQVSSARIEITEYCWSRMSFGDTQHAHSFINGGMEKHAASIVHDAAGAKVVSGICDLLILKTTDSGFENYIRDPYTTLKETSDRIMSTKCEVSWLYQSPSLNFTALYNKIRTSLLHSFAHHKSLSVQHTLYAMGEDVLNGNAEVVEISLKMPNKHHILCNLEPFSIGNNNEIFIATDEPFGYITGTIVREP